MTRRVLAEVTGGKLSPHQSCYDFIKFLNAVILILVSYRVSVISSLNFLLQSLLRKSGPGVESFLLQYPARSFHLLIVKKSH